ncbi:MAG: hypothetical protein F3740_09645, partial [Nitrospinae bacterium]|nr:hypothetical protein [Nitrospinota bacterium]
MRKKREWKRERTPKLEQHNAPTYRKKMRKERERKRERAPRLEQQDDTAVAAETSEAVDEQTAEGSAVEVKEVTGIELSAEGSAIEVKEVTGIELSAEGSAIEVKEVTG